ncbi:MAG: Rrf2 family transcriptional regulator, partial [Isosphaeraceae bacterium]|nr:Rrf2 family transcriptional regulator [Isosphaeraceae bacterium]
MHLTQFSDFAMRVVLYLGCHPDRLVSVDEISRAFGISRHHLVKVVQVLTDLGVVEAHRGRGGGMRLAQP